MSDYLDIPGVWEDKGPLDIPGVWEEGDETFDPGNEDNRGGNL
jgi:hypothetical protein